MITTSQVQDADEQATRQKDADVDVNARGVTKKGLWKLRKHNKTIWILSLTSVEVKVGNHFNNQKLHK